MLIATTNSKGGVGKTTLAVHLAVWLHERGNKVVLVDCDVQESSSAWVAEAEPGLIVVRLHTPDEILEELPELLADSTVVADGPAGLAEQTRALLLLAELALVPLGPSVLDLRAAAQAVRVLEQARKVRRGAGPSGLLVLNRLQARTRLGREVAEAASDLNIPVAQSLLSLRQAFADACGQGTVVWRMGAHARAAAVEMEKLLEEIWASAERCEKR